MPPIAQMAKTLSQEHESMMHQPYLLAKIRKHVLQNKKILKKYCELPFNLHWQKQ
jgi:hypothetical protein